MLAGTTPFPEGSIIERLTKHAKAEPTDVRVVNPAVPDELWGICRRCWPRSRPSATKRQPSYLRTLPDRAARRAAAPAAAARPTKVGGPTQLDDASAPAPAPPSPPLSLAERMVQNQPPAPTSTPSDESRRIVEAQFQHGTHAIANGQYDFGLMLLLNCCRAEPGNLAFHQVLRQAQRGRCATPGLKPWRFAADSRAAQGLAQGSTATEAAVAAC